MRHAVAMYARLIAIQIRSQAQYRSSFLLDSLASFIVSGSYYLTFVLALQRFDTLAGWNLGELSLLIGMAEFSFGLMDMVFSGFDPDAFGPRIRQGSFDQLLLRPLNITVQVMGSRFVIMRLGRVLQGLVIFLIGVTSAGVAWTPIKALYLPVVIASQVLAFAAFFVFGSTIIFWTIERIEAVNIFTYGGVEFISYPATIYPNWLRRFFTYAIPFIFISYYPALFLLDKPDPFNLPQFAPFLAPLAGLSLFLAALRFWRFGVRNYHSTGS
jgi:ABC-2 type transport system permease protein